MQSYFSNDVYHHVLDQLEAIVRTYDPAAPDMVRSDIIQVLGEELGVWPTSVFIDADRKTIAIAA